MKLSTFIVGELKILRSRADWISVQSRDPILFRSIITSLQLSETTESLAAVAVFILSHGEDNGTVFAADAMYRVDNDILFMLTADKCPYLAGKPKLIFVQACQGQVFFLIYIFDIKSKSMIKKLLCLPSISFNCNIFSSAFGIIQRTDGSRSLQEFETEF